MTAHAGAVASRSFAGPAGVLDARQHGPVDGPPLMLLHPHPRFGGTMGSRLVYDLAIGLAQDGWRVTRFDFRGVGRSQGTTQDGLGEAQDALAVLDAIHRETGAVPVVVGYSFGGAVAVRLATQRTPPRLVAIGTPLRLTESVLVPADDAPRVRCPVDLVVGDHDGFVPVPDAQRLADAFTPAARLSVLEGAAHFLEPSHNGRCVALVRRLLA